MSGKTLSAATTESLMPPNQAPSAAHTAPLGLCVVKYKCITTSVVQSSLKTFSQNTIDAYVFLFIFPSGKFEKVDTLSLSGIHIGLCSLMVRHTIQFIQLTITTQVFLLRGFADSYFHVIAILVATKSVFKRHSSCVLN